MHSFKVQKCTFGILSTLVIVNCTKIKNYLQRSWLLFVNLLLNCLLPVLYKPKTVMITAFDVLMLDRGWGLPVQLSWPQETSSVVMHSQIYESALQSTQLLFAWSCTGRMSICSSLWFGLIFDIGSLRKVLQSNPCPILLILNLNLLNLREVIRYLFLVEPIPKNKGQNPDLDKWTSVLCHAKINNFYKKLL